jgi:uncharacterized protein (TIGR03437 family)
VRQVTRTKNDTTTQQSAVAFTYGRRLSRDGRWIAFETLADDPKANNTSTNQSFLVSFVYDNLGDTFTKVGPRATVAPGDVGHFPTFTDYTGTSPATIVFSSALNFKSDGTFPAADQDSTGLNAARLTQVFAVSIPVLTTGPFTRLTNVVAGTNVIASIRPMASNSRKRIAFSMGGAEFGGGNSDHSAEIFYNLVPTITTETTATISLFTGASLIPVASPAASASGSPTPSPSPTGSPTPFIAPGLAAGELTVLNSSVTLAPASATPSNASETEFAPPLPVELKGVSVAIRGVACGLYSVSPTAITFVVPIGLNPASGTATYPIVINIEDTPGTNRVIRGTVTIVAAQPDIFTDPAVSGPGGRAAVCNATNMLACIMSPTYNVTTDNGSGTQVPTVLRLMLTGVRGTSAGSITVTIGTTAITANALNTGPTDQPGHDQVEFTLPSTVDRGDLPIVVKVGSANSRPAADAPHITINP